MLKKFLTCRISIKATPRNPSSSTEIQIPFTYYYYIHVNRSHWTFMCTSFQSCIYFLIFLLHVDWMIIPNWSELRVHKPSSLWYWSVWSFLWELCILSFLWLIFYFCLLMNRTITFTIRSRTDKIIVISCFAS